MPRPTKRTWKNSDGRVRTSWRVQYKDASGNRRSKDFQRKTGPDGADEFCRKVERELADGVHVHDRDSVTVEEAADIWLEAVRLGRNGREPAEQSTLDAYERHARLHINPYLGGLRLTKVTTPRVVSFREELLREGRSRAMTKKVLASLSAIFTEARSRGLIGSNPAEGVTIINSGRHKEEVVIPEREEVRKILDAAFLWIDEPPRAELIRSNGRKTSQPRIGSGRAQWFYVLLLVMVSTGLRLSEVRGLRWDDLHFDESGSEGYLKVTQRADRYNRIGPVKSESAFRRIELPPEVIEALREWQTLCPAGPENLTFPNMSGRVENQSNMYRRYLTPLLEECGLADRNPETGEIEGRYGFHSFRHFRASVLIASGGDLKEVQAELGHASAQMTLDTYGHLFDDEEANARRRKRAKAIFDEVLG